MSKEMSDFVTVLNALRANDSYTYCMEVTSSCENRITVEGEERINFISNNYLGFSTHPKVVEAVKEALDIYGVGIGGSPMMCGTTDLHIKLQAKIAQVYNQEASLLFTTGYQALLGSIQASVSSKDVVLLDQLVHRSIVDGVVLSGAKKRMWVHNDMEDLESLLQSVGDKYERKLIVVDSVYSMDGDIAPLPELYELKEKYNAILIVDEAHSLGVLGDKGYGILSHFDMPDGSDIISGTFSKFAGAIGGFVAATTDFVDFMKHKASPFIFSASLSPLIVAGVLKAFELLDEEPEWVDKLWNNVETFAKGLIDLGFDIGTSETPVVPLMIRDNEKTQTFNKKIFEKGIYGSPVIYPAVAPQESRIRLGVMATHTKEDIEKAMDVFKAVGKEVGVI